MKVTFSNKEPVANNIVTFWFKSPRPISYIAGQFVELQLPHSSVDNRGITRQFTLSSSPTESLLAITTRFTENRNSSFKKALLCLQPGTIVDMTEPMGDFILPKDKTLPLVFIAGGVGISPYRSIVKYLSDSGEKRNIQLLYGVKHESDIVFLDLFRQNNIYIDLIVSEPSKTWQGQTGRLSAQLALKTLKHNTDTLFYISGPELLVESLYKNLVKLGVSRDKLISDSFVGYIDQ